MHSTPLDSGGGGGEMGATKGTRVQETPHDDDQTSSAVPQRHLVVMGYTHWRSQGGGPRGPWPPQTFGECFFSPINLRRYVLLVCKWSLGGDNSVVQ